MKRFKWRQAAILLGILLLFCCAARPTPKQNRQYSAVFLDLFDTVTTIVGQAESEAAFAEIAQNIHDQLAHYHRLFDIYNDYPEIANLKTINDSAGIAPVKVDRAVIDLLMECKRADHFSGGKVNFAMGSVLRLWHDARLRGQSDPSSAALPDPAALIEAARHMNSDQVIIDEAASTVYIADSSLRLDVGAIAKGYAAQRVIEQSPNHLLLSVGGNVCASGSKTADGAPWRIAVENPDGGEPLCILRIRNASVVTSGDYQRAYWVNNRRYHHIIDPDTLFPGTRWRAVTVVCADSGMADALSTALFLLDQPQGQALLDACGAQACWVCADGTLLYSAGFAAFAEGGERALRPREASSE